VSWVLTGLALFGIGFGFVESAVVVDLRATIAPAVGWPNGRLSDDLFPWISMDRLQRIDPPTARLMSFELLREAATLVVLAGCGIAAGRTSIQRFAAFLIGFGVWDLSYYLFLKLLLGWPASLWTWDVLFLIPVPWAAPVLAPSLAAASMVIAGSAVILWEAAGTPFQVSRWEWAAILAGGTILVVSFCWDWSHIAAGGMPRVFPWTIFMIGEALGFGGFLHASWVNWSSARAGELAVRLPMQTGLGTGDMARS
jgi:hypothetical protein